MRKLVLLFLVSDMDGAHRWLLAEWSAVRFAAVSCWLSREPRWRPNGRQIICALGCAARSPMDSRGVPHGDSTAARRHGGLSRKDRGGGAFEFRFRRHGFDAALSMGLMP